MIRSFLANFDEMAFYGISLMVGAKKFVGNCEILVEVYKQELVIM